VSRLWPDRPRKYSRALLETIALIAYRQPITRAEIEHVRGVAVNPEIVKTLMERNWVRVVGHRDVPGHPELLGTTDEFLDYFSLRSIEDLPPLAELKSLGDLNLQLPLPGTVDGVVPVADAGTDSGVSTPRRTTTPMRKNSRPPAIPLPVSSRRRRPTSPDPGDLTCRVLLRRRPAAPSGCRNSSHSVASHRDVA
jgi:hypothetical protein